MFKKGDILKVRTDMVEYEYGGCKGSTVYKSMVDAAEKYRFKVLEANPGQYKLERLPDKQIDIKRADEVHKLLEIANN